MLSALPLRRQRGNLKSVDGSLALMFQLGIEVLEHPTTELRVVLSFSRTVFIDSVELVSWHPSLEHSLCPVLHSATKLGPQMSTN